MERGIRRVLGSDNCAITHVPLADGGEGTVDALLASTGGTRQTSTVRGPLGEPVQASWGILPNGSAVIEMAQASGLPLVPPELRDAGRASSFGTGELIRAALDAGCHSFLLGLGGSATTDGGTGLLQALGARFLDSRGAELPPGGAALASLHHIDLSALDERLAQSQITVLCDVTNPLYGPYGAAPVYGPQKGASPAEVKQLNAALENFAGIATQVTGLKLHDQPGAGAAGGMGYGLLTFAGARLQPGIEVVLAAANFGELLEKADLVLTAEGAIDVQTPQGKALAGVARAARSAHEGKGVPVIAFGGAVKLTGTELEELGIIAALPLPDGPMALDECVQRAGELLADAAERAMRLVNARTR